MEAMSNEEIRMGAIRMDTPALANWLQTLAEEKRGMKGRIGYNVERREQHANIKRYIKILAQELNSRQVRMKGF